MARAVAVQPLAAAAFAGTAAVAFAADQLTKAWAVVALRPGKLGSLVPGLLQLCLTSNTGASFGLFAGWPGALTAITAAALVVFVGLWIVYAANSTPGSAALGLLAGGTAGNLADRIARGGVVDFLQFQFAPWWPAFNIADCAIVAGAAALAAMAIFGPRAQK